MLKHFLVLISFLWMCNGIAQTKFYATISAKEIGKEDYLQLKLVVENANTINKISNPMLTNFSIESGPNEESSNVSINGRVNKKTALVYILKPKTIGAFTIPSIIAILDGKEYKSEKILIKVVDKNTLSESNKKVNIADYIIRDGEMVSDKIKGNLFIKGSINKKQIYIGEPIELIYKLYTRLKSESGIVKNPSFNGFSAIDMDIGNAYDYNLEKLNGVDYNVYLLRKVQLFPLQAGLLSIDKIEVENNITFIKQSYLKKRLDNFFDDFGQTPLPQEAVVNHKINIESEVININVMPLPSKAIPSQFKGAVGNFSINSKLKDDKVFTNTTNQLIVTIAGKGNLHLINSPEIKWPAGFESFETVVTDEIDKTTLPISGSKTFTIPFVVSDTGKYFLDSIDFSFFDFQTEQYKKVFTKPIELFVKKGARKNVATNNNTNSAKNWMDKFNENRKYVVSVFAALIALGIMVWFKKDKKQQTNANTKSDLTAEIISEEEKTIVKKDWLQNTKEVLLTEDETLFCKTIHTELVSFLSHKFNIDRAMLNKQTILNAMQQNNIDSSIIEEVSATLLLLDDKLYNPFSGHNETLNMTYVYNSVQNCIGEMSET